MSFTQTLTFLGAGRGTAVAEPLTLALPEDMDAFSSTLPALEAAAGLLLASTA